MSEITKIILARIGHSGISRGDIVVTTEGKRYHGAFESVRTEADILTDATLHLADGSKVVIPVSEIKSITPVE